MSSLLSPFIADVTSILAIISHSQLSVLTSYWPFFQKSIFEKSSSEMIFVIFFFLGIAIFSGSVDYGVCGGI